MFIPLLFMTGVVGRLFSEFAVTLSVSVIVSAIISLTLTPMMCGRLLRPLESQHPGHLSRVLENGFNALQRVYGVSLRWALRRQGLVLLVALATLAGTIGLYIVVPKGFLPQQDTGVILGVTQGAQDISITRLADMQNQAAEIAARDPAVANVVSFVGVGTINPTPNAGQLTMALKPIGQRSSAPNLIDRISNAITHIPGLSAWFKPVQDITLGTRASRTAYQYTLVDTDRSELNAWAPRLVDQLRTVPALRNVDSDQQNRGVADRDHRGPPGRGTARRDHAGDRGHALRQLRPAPGLDHLRAGQPVPRGPGIKQSLAG